MTKVELLTLIVDYANSRALSEAFLALDEKEKSDRYLSKSLDDFNVISDVLLNDGLEV